MKPKSRKYFSLLTLFLAFLLSSLGLPSTVEANTLDSPAPYGAVSEERLYQELKRLDPKEETAVQKTPEPSTSKQESLKNKVQLKENPTHVDAKQKLQVIVETNNEAALDLADRHDKAAFQKAVQTSEQAVKNSYKNIQATLKAEGLELKAGKFFSAGFTGFSTEVTPAVAQRLGQLEGVRQVTEQNFSKRPDVKPAMDHSGELIGWVDNIRKDFPFKGENVVVSVLDTGFDPDHKDFILGDDIEKRYDKETMDAVIRREGLPGKWFSNKIPYGYNYADLTTGIKDTMEQHGNHVTGTIGANGQPEQGGIQGVAPHVQILAMKVFSNDHLNSSVYEDVWLKAIDDSIKLGADVINMSLGGSAGFVMNGQTPSERAFQRARAAGILPVVAVGNDHNATWGTDDHNLATNPDNSLAGSPATAPSAFGVASVDNVRQHRPYIEAIYREGQEKLTFMRSDSMPEGTLAPTPIVSIGLGLPSDYEGKNLDLTGKIALIQRGESSFGEKYDLAVQHGAAGVLIYDNVDSDFTMEMTGVTYQEGHPVAFIRKVAGEKMLALNKAYPDFKVAMPKGLKSFDVKTAGNVSEFSSWGPTTDLSLKPEIAAPGGLIYSTIGDDKYMTMSGTSMATPHIAGLAALVIQRLYRDGILKGSIEHKDHTQPDLAQLFLMNTAIPSLNSLDGYEWYYTPKEQGAGVVNIVNAVKNWVTVTATGTNDTTADGKLEIKEVGDEFTVNLNLKNYGEEAKTYDVMYISLASTVDENGRYTEKTKEAQRAHIGSITVPGHETATFTNTVSTYGIARNQYVEGYFLLMDRSEDPINLSVPYLGFKGHWDEPKLIDDMVDFVGEDGKVNFRPIRYFDEQGNQTGVDKAGFVYRRQQGGWKYWNAHLVDGKPTIFVNSHQKTAGLNNEIAPVVSFLRNGKNVVFKIEDTEGNVLRRLFAEPRFYKVGRLYSNKFNFLQLAGNAAWDFTDAYGKPVPEGHYRYVIEGQIDSPDAKTQRFEYDIVLDNTAPRLQAYFKGDQLIVKGQDLVSGIRGFEIHHKEADYWQWQIWEQAYPGSEVNSFNFPLDEVMRRRGTIEVFAYDYAGNTGQLELKVPEELVLDLAVPAESEDPTQEGEEEESKEPELNDPAEDPGMPGENLLVDPLAYSDGAHVKGAELPIFTLTDPNYYWIFNQKDQQINVKGTISQLQDLHRVEAVLLDGEGRPMDYLEALPFHIKKDKFSFEKALNIAQIKASGKYDLILYAYGKSEAGHLVKRQILRPIRIDRVAPEMTVKQVSGADPNKAYFTITYKEDMNYLEIQANNELVLREDRTYESLKPLVVEGSVDFAMPLHPGENKITFTAYDDAGNETQHEVVIQHEEKPEGTSHLNPKTTENI